MIQIININRLSVRSLYYIHFFLIIIIDGIVHNNIIKRSLTNSKALSLACQTQTQTPQEGKEEIRSPARLDLSHQWVWLSSRAWTHPTAGLLTGDILDGHGTSG